MTAQTARTIPDWEGLYCEVTTQLGQDGRVDLEATERHQRRLLEHGIRGIVALGKIGEGHSLEFDERLAILKVTARVADGRIATIAAVNEPTTEGAGAFARRAEECGSDGLLLLPLCAYAPSPGELCAHVRHVAAATGLPIMLCEEPPAAFGLDLLDQLADLPTVAAINLRCVETRRIADIQNRFGDRFAIMTGLDDAALGSLLIGATGWISSVANAFPEDARLLYEAAAWGEVSTAQEIHGWFLQLLHLDSDPDRVQAIKLLCSAIGPASEHVRSPRQPLHGRRREFVLELLHKALAERPSANF